MLFLLTSSHGNGASILLVSLKESGCKTHLFIASRSLPLLVKGHDYASSSMAFHNPGMLLEGLFSFLEGDGVDNALALTSFQASLNNVELRCVQACQLQKICIIASKVMEVQRTYLASSCPSTSSVVNKQASRNLVESEAICS